MPIIVTLNSMISALYKKSTMFTDQQKWDKTLFWPNVRTVPEYVAFIQKTNNTSDGGNLLNMSDLMIKRFSTAMSYADKEGVLDTLTIKTTRVRIKDFMAMSEPAQIAAIDQIWSESTDKKTYDTSFASMTDAPDSTVAPEKKPLPSSLVPNTSGGVP